MISDVNDHKLPVSNYPPPRRTRRNGGQTINYKLSLIIPAYNEEQRIGAFLQSIADFVRSEPDLITEIFVVNDGSTDRTADVVGAYQETLRGLKLLAHDTNRGKGAAVRTGVMAAQGNLVAFMDADGATPITELPKMVHSLESADVAIGNRWMRGALTLRHSRLRQLSGFVYRTYMRLFGLGAIDTMCGFKGFRRDAARALFSHLHEPGWLFDTEICYRAVKSSYRITNFPISWESKAGSKLDTKTLLKTALQIRPLIQRMRTNEKTTAV